jgi:hypothetical protein
LIDCFILQERTEDRNKLSLALWRTIEKHEINEKTVVNKVEEREKEE